MYIFVIYILLSWWVEQKTQKQKKPIDNNKQEPVEPGDATRIGFGHRKVVCP